MSDHNAEGPNLKDLRRVSGSDAERRESMFTATPTPDTNAARKTHQLDTADMHRLHDRLMNLYTSELERQRDNRREQAEDEAFYDNEQWSTEDRQVMEDRGQYPLTYNVIMTPVDWILGTQRRMRTDYSVLPRRKDAGKAAERKSQLLKYLDDVNRTQFDVSQAFTDQVKVGIGWTETGVQEDDDGEPVYIRYESWRNMLWDSAATQRDMSDARYVMRTRWVDEDIAKAMFEGREGIIEGAVNESGNGYIEDDGDEPMDAAEDSLNGISMHGGMDYQRPRVRIIECWYRTPMEKTRLRGSEFSGELYDELSPGHQEALASGKAELVKRVMMRMNVAIMTSEGFLWCSESPYRHNGFPFTPYWGKRRGRDNMPYGIIRSLKDPQRDVNKRAAKALHILSTNKVIMDKGAVDDMGEFEDEMAKADSIIEKNKGYELVINADRELAGAHMDLMQRSINMIQQTSGVTDENLGRQTNASSGKAIQARQDQGSLATSLFFDNLLLARQMQGEKEISLIEQFFSDEKQFRITNMRGRPEYITVNDGLPENDITRSKADFVISEQQWNATLRQSQSEELMNMLGQLGQVAPQLAMVMIDLIVESMDLPNRDELVSRIRAVTGQRDPDAEEPTPEEQQRAQQQQQEQQLAMRERMAKIAKDEAQAGKYSADAQTSQGKARAVLAELAGTNVQTQREALEAALVMLQAPGSEGVADQMLHEAGFQSRTEQEEDARQAGVIQGEQMAQQQAMAQQQQLQQQQAAEQAAAEEQQARAQQQGQYQAGAEQRDGPAGGMGLPAPETPMTGN